MEKETKRCSRCGQVKPIGDFYRDKTSKDGLANWCKECHKEVRKEYYAKHRGEILKKQAEWRANNKEKKAAYNADYYQANKDKIAEYHDPILNPLNWAKNMVNGYRKMDRDRGFDDSKTITAEWFLKNIAYRPCAHCGLRKVGAIGANRLNNNIGHEASNLEPCCSSCNKRENNRDMLERGLYWFQKREKVDFKTFVNEHKAKHKNLA